MEIWSQLKGKIRLSYSVVVLCAVNLLFYVITEILHWQNSHVLEFTPADVFTGSIWQILTAGFTENYAICVILNICVFVSSNRFMEPVWGTWEFVKFIMIVNASSYIISLLILFVGFILLKEEGFLYAPFCGGHGLIAGIFVALKQLIPDHVILHTLTPFRVRHLPILSFVLSMVFTIARLTSTRYLTINMAGLATAWIYLRYFQVHERGRGDISDTLSITSFFPEFAQPHLIKYSSVIANLGGVVDKLDRTAESVPSAHIDLSQHNITERHRQLALQALNERLRNTEAEDVEWPESDPESSSEVV